MIKSIQTALTLAILLFLAFQCQRKSEPVNDQVMDMEMDIGHEYSSPLKELLPRSKQRDLEIVFIDTAKSVVKWTGTKLMGTGKHEGITKFVMGELHFNEGKLSGGKFEVDMSSIYITDIPLSDPVPRKNLTTHLNSDFETTKFPKASFTINHVTDIDSKTFTLDGMLRIKGISNPMSITAREVSRGNHYTATFTFDRFDWKIGEDGSWFEKKLVDAEVMLSVELFSNSLKK